MNTNSSNLTNAFRQVLPAAAKRSTNRGRGGASRSTKQAGTKTQNRESAAAVLATTSSKKNKKGEKPDKFATTKAVASAVEKNKGFAHVVPEKSKSEVLQAAKQFAKEIGAPDATICDHSGEQTSISLKRFCQEIGTTLRVLEEGIPWSNKAELYIMD